MKNIYLVQANAVYGDDIKSTYIPYAVGCLAAYAMSFEDISSEYSLRGLIYTRKNIRECAASLEKPFLAGFSCSVWNSEYNKALSREIKRLYPDCVCVFGGHQLPVDSQKAFEEYPDADIIIHGGGEEAFAEILRALAKGESPAGADNTAVKLPDGKIISGRRVQPSTPDYPSPYLSGVFDSILQDGFEFSAIIETNRGCPNSCAFCDWGALGSKVRLFSMEKVFGELLWLSEHKIEYVYCADANFGLFSRDMDITRRMVQLKEQTGYPKKLKVNFTKNRYEFVGEISRLLNESGMGKSQTLSFQSVSDEVLHAIGRKNIGLEHFRRLLALYSAAGIPTYSELILGLPNETAQSFAQGLCTLIENGQHKSINVYPCELLPESRLGSAEFIEKYKIGTTRLPFRQFHCTGGDGDEVTEYSNIITSTASMPRDDWVYAYLFACTVQSFHLLGIVRDSAILLRRLYGVSYKDFYTELLSFALSGENECLYGIFSAVKAHLQAVSEGKSPVCFYDGRFGAISFEPDEYMFLCATAESDRLFEEAARFIGAFIPDSTLSAELIAYQRALLNLPGLKEKSRRFKYDFPAFFSDENAAELEKKDISLRFVPAVRVNSFSDYARECVWYGRRNEGMRNTAVYLTDIKEETVNE